MATCGTTGKIIYVSQKEAWRVVTRLRKRRIICEGLRKPRVVTDVFRCEFCQAWHIGRRAK